MSEDQTPYGRLWAYLDLLPEGEQVVGAGIVVDNDLDHRLTVQRNDLESVLYELELWREERKDPALGWQTAAVEAASYERAAEMLAQVGRIVKVNGTRELWAVVKDVLDNTPDLEHPRRPDTVEDLRRTLDALRTAEGRIIAYKTANAEIRDKVDRMVEVHREYATTAVAEIADLNRMLDDARAEDIEQLRRENAALRQQHEHDQTALRSMTRDVLRMEGQNAPAPENASQTAAEPLPEA